MSVKRVYTISGQKRTGKDTLGEMMWATAQTNGYSAKIYRFADPLKEFGARLLNAAKDSAIPQITLEKLEDMKNEEALLGKRDFPNTQNAYNEALKIVQELHSDGHLPQNGMSDEEAASFIIENSLLRASNAREFLQLLGTEAFKPVFGKEIWPKITIAKIKKEAPDVAIIADARFLEEINLVKEEFGSKALSILIVKNEDDLVDYLVFGEPYRHLTKMPHPSERDFFLYRNYDYKIINDKDLSALRVHGWAILNNSLDPNINKDLIPRSKLDSDVIEIIRDKAGRFWRQAYFPNETRNRYFLGLKGEYGDEYVLEAIRDGKWRNGEYTDEKQMKIAEDREAYRVRWRKRYGLYDPEKEGPTQEEESIDKKIQEEAIEATEEGLSFKP
jgi:hypothetical protein